MTRLTAYITCTGAAAIMQRLSGAAHQLPADDDRTIDQTRADVLAVVLEQSPSSSRRPAPTTNSSWPPEPLVEQRLRSAELFADVFPG